MAERILDEVLKMIVEGGAGSFEEARIASELIEQRELSEAALLMYEECLCCSDKLSGGAQRSLQDYSDLMMKGRGDG